LTRLLNHVRRQAVGYVALLVALGGTSYAATSLPNGSVGTAQLRNGSVTNTKLNRGAIGGYVRAWASTNGLGELTGSSDRAKVTENGALLRFTWRGKFPRHKSSCTPIATPTDPNAGANGSNASLAATWTGGSSVNVYLDPTAEEKAVSVALIC
jgi:hypothetical protein